MNRIFKVAITLLVVLVLIGVAARTYNVRYSPIRHAEFWGDGSLREVGSYRNGKPFGEWSTYYPGGARKTSYTLDAKGRLVDSLFKWHPSGEIWVKGCYKDGDKIGCWTWFDANGGIIMKECY